MADWTSQAREALRQGPAALVTILATEGSAPRGPGARMVVTETGLAGHDRRRRARASGDGAGARDPRARAGKLARAGLSARAAARPMLRRAGPAAGRASGRACPRAKARSKSSCPIASSAGCSPAKAGARDADGAREARSPTAGARFVEPVETDRLPVLLFGAGHVGRAIAARAAGLPLHLAWYRQPPRDGRDARASSSPTRTRWSPARPRRPSDAAVVILTHDHGLDYRLTAAALGGRARFVGLIGSKTKRARFLSRLAADGSTPRA